MNKHLRIFEDNTRQLFDIPPAAANQQITKSNNHQRAHRRAVTIQDNMADKIDSAELSNVDISLQPNSIFEAIHGQSSEKKRV